jgi:Sulfotransferase family
MTDHVARNGSGLSQATGAAPPTTGPGAVTAPVFVLCGARSGSTLLRFVLDAHPELTCPPETNLPALCAQVATVWSLIEGAPLSPERGDESAEIPEAAIGGARRVMDMMISAYLDRRGAGRYCDKSLGTARFAQLLLRVYPDAKFLCLYRHPMDVIASGIEACPWGLNGYGFDPYVAGSPSNAVLALARFWGDNASAILAAEEQFPASCHRVRYEDLVADPQRAAEEIFGFLGVAPVPDIAARCFTAERERFGLGDYKIWHTGDITAASVGRGWAVPAALIPGPVLDQVNTLASKLGYLEVDGDWGTTAVPPDVRMGQAGGPAGRAASGEPEPGAVLVAERLRAGLAKLDQEFLRRWDRWAAEPFGVAVTGAGGETRWRVDPATRTITQPAGPDDDTEWDILGSAAAWQDVLRGRVNLSVALRRHDLRYCDTEGAGHVSLAARIDMLAAFLGLASWKLTAAGGHDNTPGHAASERVTTPA